MGLGPNNTNEDLNVSDETLMSTAKQMLSSGTLI